LSISPRLSGVGQVTSLRSFLVAAVRLEYS